MRTNIEKLFFYAKHGLRDKDWYAKHTSFLTATFGASNLNLVCNLLAATSINTSLKGNVTLFRKAWHEIENGLPSENYLPNIATQINRVRQGLPLSGRKISNFASALQGNLDAVVVDIWILRAFEMDRKYYRKESSTFATDQQYSYIEGSITYLANYHNLEPAELCAMIWSGIRTLTSKDPRTNYLELLDFHYNNLFA